MLRTVPRWAVWVTVAVALVAAFSAGRFSAPEAIEVERVAHAEVTGREKSKSATATETNRKAATITRMVPTPGAACDGGVAVTTETMTITSENTRTLAELTRASELTTSSTSSEKSKTTVRPDWRVGLLVGAQVAGKPALEIAGPLVLGATVDRRVIGGLSGGVWGTTSGAAGVGVSVEF